VDLPFDRRLTAAHSGTSSSASSTQRFSWCSSRRR
jgi:hypothetical protein